MAKLTIDQTMFIRASAERIDAALRDLQLDHQQRAHQTLELTSLNLRKFIQTDGFQSKGKHRG